MRFLVVFAAMAGGLYAQPEFSVQTVAGSDWVGDGGSARQALLIQAEGVAVDRTGNLYIADAAGNAVRMVDTDGVIHTVATGLAAPYGLAFDPAGNLHIADLGNARVVRLERDGSLTPVVDTGLTAPRNLAFDRAGNLYISDFSGHTVYRRTPAGAISVVAGPNLLAFPTGVAVDAAGAVYIADSLHHVVRKVNGATITTVADVASPVGIAFDAAGVLHVADVFTGQVLRFGVNGPLPSVNVAARDVAFGPGGTLYAASGEYVRRITLGVNSIFAGGGDRAHGDFGPAIMARLNAPAGVAVDAVGNLYIADRDNHRVRRVNGDGIITTIAGAGLPGDSGDGGLATRALLNKPADVAVDRAGNVFIADRGNRRVRLLTPGGVIQTIAIGLTPSNIAVNDAGTVFVTDDTFVYRIDAGGVLARLGAPLTEPATLAADLGGRAIDANGVIYAADAAANRVYAYTPVPEPVVEIAALHAATLQLSAVAPGLLMVVRGMPAKWIDSAEIRFAGFVAPVLARSGNELTVQAPAIVATLDTVTIDLRVDGVSRASVLLPVAPAAPGLFAAVTPDGSPAERGGILVLYGTGEGVSEAPVKIAFSGYEGEILYSGPVAAYPGLWQVNVRVPAGFLPPGEHAVVATVGGYASQPLLVAIK